VGKGGDSIKVAKTNKGGTLLLLLLLLLFDLIKLVEPMAMKL